MKKLAETVLILALAVGMAQAAQTVDYGWENGGTILGSFGNLVNPLNVTTGSDPTLDPNNPQTVTPRGGSRMLQVTESPHSSTPQAYIAFIEGLEVGDQVTASFWGWDTTPGGPPSLRIWGHYADSGDVNSYRGSASGPTAYTTGDPNDPWSQVSHTWTFDADPNDPNRPDALVVEARLYSTPATDPNGSTDYWIDDLSVTAPDGATISVPIPEPAAVVLLALGGLLMLLGRLA